MLQLLCVRGIDLGQDLLGRIQPALDAHLGNLLGHASPMHEDEWVFIVDLPGPPVAHARARGGLDRPRPGTERPGRANLDRTAHGRRLRPIRIRTTNGSLERCWHDESRNAPDFVAQCCPGVALLLP